MSTSRIRALNALVDNSMSQIWENMRKNKENELTMLNQEIQYNRKEASAIKQNLMTLGISLPEVDQTNNYENASNIPLATIGGNINMAEKMLQNTQGQVDAYTQALTNYNQGINLMNEMETTYADANSQLEPLGPNAPYEQDYLQWSNPEAYKDFMLEGGMTYNDDTGFSFPGSSVDTPSEMEQLFNSLDSETQERLKNQQFREGFLASKTSEEQAVISVTDRINTERQLLQIRNDMKTATLADIDRLRSRFQEEKNQLGAKMSPTVVLGGQSLQMATLALQAGDTETWEKTMSIISEDPGLQPIMHEITTLINGSISGAEDDPYGAYINVVGSAYQEYMDLMSIGDKWEEQFGTEKAKKYIKDAKKRGRKANIPDAFKEEAGQLYNLYNRHTAFNYSGILHEDAAAIQSVLMLDSMDKQLTDTEIQFLGMRGRDDIEDYYARGPFGGQLEDFEDQISGVYDPDHPDFDKEAYELQQAHLEYIAMNTDYSGETVEITDDGIVIPQDNSVDEIVNELGVIEQLNSNADLRTDVNTGFQNQKTAMWDWIQSWDDSIGGGWKFTSLEGATNPITGEFQRYNYFSAMIEGLPSRNIEGTVLYDRKGTDADIYGLGHAPAGDMSLHGSSFETEPGQRWDGIMFMNDTEVLMQDLAYLDEIVAQQLVGLSSERRHGPGPDHKWYNLTKPYDQFPVTEEENEFYGKKAWELYVNYVHWRDIMIQLHKDFANAKNSGAFDEIGGLTGAMEHINYNYDAITADYLSDHKNMPSLRDLHAIHEYTSNVHKRRRY